MGKLTVLQQQNQDDLYFDAERYEDWDEGQDARGDYATFIESKHIVGDGWSLSKEGQELMAGCEPTFFRLLMDGVQHSSHGWIEDGEIVQWG